MTFNYKFNLKNLQKHLQYNHFCDKICNEQNKRSDKMANIKSAQKRIDVTKRNTLQNKMAKSQMKTQIKKYNNAINTKDVESAEKLLPTTFEVIDKTVTKGAIHKNQANRRKSTLASELDALKKESK